MKRLYTTFTSICLLLATIAVTHANTFNEQQIKDDFAQLYEDLQSSSYNFFAHTDKDTFDRHYLEFQNQINGNMTQLEVHRLFLRFVALADIAHTRIDFPIQFFREFLNSGGKTLPLSIRVEADSVIITEYLGLQDIKQGDKLINVNGQPALIWLDTLAQYLAADDSRLAYVLLEAWGIAPYLWLHEGEQPQYTLTLERAHSGEQYEVVQPTLSHETQEQHVASQAIDDSEPREYQVLSNQIGYLKPGEFYNVYAEDNNQIWDTTEFHSFIDEAMHTFLDANVKDIVIDVRGNAGGTNSFSDHLIGWYADEQFRFASEFRVKVSEHSRNANLQRLALDDDPESITAKLEQFYAQNEQGDVILFPLEDSYPHSGDMNISDSDIQIYVWIDRFSFSNAVSVAAITKDYGFGTVIGEKTADPATTYAAMETFTLENTGISVGYPKALIVRPNGNPVADGVTPDIQLECPEGSGEAALSCLREFILEQRVQL
ncbi:MULTISPECIES: S41 family peptidase [Gammaproteobacteria]|uniref:S41 family peptidase n=1 Tax=Gammaproteobacteria TaxID=1236 RepID=UPI000DD01DD6|nr:MULTISPECIES: S41 family peptidase [Gammaproteobacteria]RTE86564.1 hypothetical protein DQX04_08395 [Aliidiomarina sp. B3213]TCZ90881.1 hypothetical protein EYQ95_08650 [Lysobacter sp. N42]